MNLLLRILACLLVLASIPAAGAAGAEAGATESLSDRLGPEIDSAERSHYGLFPDLPDFGTGRFDSSKGAYRLIYKEVGDGGARRRGRTVSLEAFRQTAWHVAFVEEHEAAAGGDGVPPSLSEPDLLRRLALRYASRKRYDLASAIAADLRDVHAAEPAGTWAMDAIPRFEALAGPRRALIWPGALLDQRGRTDLIVFSGYYGLWLGIAIPVALESEDAQTYAAGLLAAPAASFISARATHRSRTPPCTGAAGSAWSKACSRAATRRARMARSWTCWSAATWGFSRGRSPRAAFA